MATAWGVDRDANGNGTTPEDFQRIIASMFMNAGTVDGLDVKGTASMAYTVSAGSAIIDTGPDMAVWASSPAITVLTDPAPTTGSPRVDTIYIKQNFPGSQGDSFTSVGVAKGVAAPANSVVIGRFTVGLGITATTAAVQNKDRDYARPVGGSLGTLVKVVDSDPTLHRFDDPIKKGQGRFVVPTDRNLELHLTSTVLRTQANGTPQPGNLRAALRYHIYVDNTLVETRIREYQGHYAKSEEFTIHTSVLAGEHTVHYTVWRVWTETGINDDNDYWKIMHGGAEKYPGDVIIVKDVGVAK